MKEYKIVGVIQPLPLMWGGDEISFSLWKRNYTRRY